MVNGEKIRQLRKEKDITVEVLAKSVGVGHPMMVFIEKGFRQPSVDLLRRIADYFDVSTDYLLDRDRTNTA